MPVKKSNAVPPSKFFFFFFFFSVRLLSVLRGHSVFPMLYLHPSQDFDFCLDISNLAAVIEIFVTIIPAPICV